MSVPIARERRHTLVFLDEIRSTVPVFLDTEVDMTAVRAHQDAARAEGRRFSLVTYVLLAAGRVLAAHPEANAAIRGRLRPRVARYAEVNGKLTLDKTLNGQRIVLAAVLPGLDRASLAEIQATILRYQEADPAVAPEFGGARLLHRLPRPFAALAYRAAVRPLGRRPEVFGTFALTSLGHRPVDGFHSIGGTTVTIGVGRAADRPAVRDGRLTIAPLMRLSLTFDHRVIDGAEAADVLADLKTALEDFKAETDEVST
jgi:pyruvate/2-oxoglutarate dehydrogenase complex dihydrolipoamide acyltransferase (E2) component